MRHIDLFAGIGGFSLAADWCWGEEAEHVMFCEKDEWARKILKKHWPDVPTVKDICELSTNPYVDIDLITAGWPCQDNSIANHDRKGLSGDRTGLWSELMRVFSEIRPRFGLFENVTNAIMVNGGRDFNRCLCDLAKVGYDAEWACLRASAAGAPHHRERVFILTYPSSIGLQKRKPIISNVLRSNLVKKKPRELAGATCMVGEPWSSEPPVCGTPHGLPRKLDRIRGLGNAIVPQVALQLMNAIREIDNESGNV